MSADIQGLRVVITGAAGGIGAAAVEGFHQLGARVAAIYNASRPSDAPAGVSLYKCDLTDKTAVMDLFEKIGTDLGGIDALVHVAGTWRGTPAEDVEEEQIDFLIDVNLKSTIFTNQAAFRAMKGQGGRIINFGSVEGVEGNVRSPVYASTKAAVHAWTRSAARAWGEYGINVNAVAPIMQTPLFDYNRSLLTEEQNAHLDADLKARIPIDGKMGDPLRDCVPVLAFLAGDGARFMTGQLLSIDGGLRMLGA